MSSSASALRQLKHHLDEAIVAYEVGQAEQYQPANQPGICLGGDETFLGLPILVLIELASGFILRKSNVRIVVMTPGLNSLRLGRIRLTGKNATSGQ